MTLSLYPLVYLPVAAALAKLDRGLEEAARSLGLGPWQAFWRVTLRQIRPAVLGGCLLVTLALLAEFGAFEIVQYQTFTVAIFTEFKLGFDAVGRERAVARARRAERRSARRRALAGGPRRGSAPRRRGHVAAPRRIALGRAHGAGARGSGRAQQPGARGSDRRARLLDAARQLDDAAVRLDPRRGRTYGRVQRRARPCLRARWPCR